MTNRGAEPGSVRPSRPPLPASFGLALDPATRRIDGGRVLIGGSPLRLLRLSDAGAVALDRLLAGEPVGAVRGAGTLARRLVDAGVAHPRPDRTAPAPGPGDVTVVIPVHDTPEALARTLAALAHRRTAGPAVGPSPGAADDGPVPRRVIVVDDGSADPTAVAEVAAAHGADLVRHDHARGPAAARNAGLAQVRTPIVAFVDCDVEVRPDWLRWLLPHLADPAVVALAPRVGARAVDTDPSATTIPPPRSTDHRPSTEQIADTLARYEEGRSPLDLGPQEGRVRPRTRVAYVPATTLVARTGAVTAIGGFDEGLRYGEDVDLVWRLQDAGGDVRYEPAARVTHPVRADPLGWARQRFAYGTSAAPLAARHPGDLAPVAVSGWTAAAWALAAAGHPLVGAGVGLAGTARLPDRLAGLDHPAPEAVRLAVAGTWGAWRPLATAVTRAWWPVALGAAVVSRRARRVAIVAALAPAAVDWARGERPVDLPRYLALRLADDLAYGAGVWAGCRRTGSFEALRPALGRRRAPTAP